MSNSISDPATRLSVPSKPKCPSWCVTPDCEGEHYSASVAIPTMEPDCLDVTLAQAAPQTSVVMLGSAEREEYWDLTPRQAERLARQLLTAARQAGER